MSMSLENLEDFDSPASIDLNSLIDTAHYVDDFLYTIHIVSATIGIPINLLLIGIFVVLRRLRLSRNFTWIGIGISNICILVKISLCAHFPQKFQFRKNSRNI